MNHIYDHAVSDIVGEEEEKSLNLQPGLLGHRVKGHWVMGHGVKGHRVFGSRVILSDPLTSLGVTVEC